jgi:O-antigen ligase
VSSSKKFNFLVLIFSIVFIFSVFSRFSGSLGVYLAVFLVLCIAFTFFFNNFEFSLNIYFLPVLLFITTAIVSYFFADYKCNVRNEIFLLSSCAMLYLLKGFLNNYEKRNVLIIPVLIGLWLTIYLFAVNFAFSKFFEPGMLTEYMRSTSCFLLLALSLSFVFWWSEKKIYFYISFLIFLAIIMTKSFLAISAAGLVFAVYLFFIREKIKIKTTLTVVPFILISFVSFYFLFKSSFFYDKILVWKTALFIIKDNFLFGVGFNNYKTVSLAYSTIEDTNILYPDNIFLQVLSESGIFGFIFFIAMLTIFFYFILKKLKTYDKTLYLPVLISVISFLFYNFFSSSAFVSTNMLLFFFLLAFPLDFYNVKQRKKKINSYVIIVLFLPFVIAVGKPLYAVLEYEKGLSFFATQKYSVAKDYFINAINNDSINPEYTSRLADVYFAIYQKTEKKVFLDFAIELSNYSSSLNKYNGKYYYQLAWLYHFKNDKQQAAANITKAVEMDSFNSLYLEHITLLS